MPLFRLLSFFALLVCCNNRVAAQPVSDPTSWTYEAKKTGDGMYLVRFHLQLKDGWHIWSLNPGGDGFQIVPSFRFDLKKGMKTIGKISESGKLIVAEVEGIEGKVNYYSHKVTYEQSVVAAPGTVLSGKHEYQVCTDVMCLPPVEKTFSLELK